MSFFSLVLFSVCPVFINQATQGGICHVIVDLETRGKQKRQEGYDTQISKHNFSDIQHIKENTDVRVIARINGPWDKTTIEINKAIEFGTDEILLPMVKTINSVENALKDISGRCDLGIMIETIEAVQICDQLSNLPLSRVYVGLNDLAISRHDNNIFKPLADGTIDEIREHFSQPFGFGGLTLPHAGSPIPCKLLISENARLKTQFSILRRSFFRDVEGKNVPHEIGNLLNEIKKTFRKSGSDLENDHRQLQKLVAKLTS